MRMSLEISFAPKENAALKEGAEILVCLAAQVVPSSFNQGGDALHFGPQTRMLSSVAEGRVARAAKASCFKGSMGSSVCLLAVDDFDILCVVGLGEAEKLQKRDWSQIGGAVTKALPEGLQGKVHLRLLLEHPDGQEITPEQATEVALGLVLGAYRFDRYKTQKELSNSEILGLQREDGELTSLPQETSNMSKEQHLLVEICTDANKEAQTLWEERRGLAEGIICARDLVNQPANVLTTCALVEAARALVPLGVRLDVLDRAQLETLGLRALLGVAQGSKSPPYLVVAHWQGAAAEHPPVALVGKGVVFDSGGISIKPAANMESMKGDMAGAAAVIGILHAVARQKRPVNVIGVLAVVENMPGGAAQRPGDIVRTLSGQTVEIINTDAEGRLILADALWYTQTTYTPSCVIDLATLTGAVLIALGQYRAGLFSNDTVLAEQLFKAGQETGEQIWRLPLDPLYDAQLKSNCADMKNTGGRTAGAITAAQFLQRFIRAKTRWAHLDIAGVGLESPETLINKSWANGFGVRLLDCFLEEYAKGETSTS